MASDDPLATLFPAAEKRSPFQDWPWPEWDPAVDHPVMAADKDLNYSAGANYAFRCLVADGSPLDDETVETIRNWPWNPNYYRERYEHDTCNLAIYHKGAMQFIHAIRDVIPDCSDEHWTHLRDCVDDLERHVHIQFITRMKNRMDRPITTVSMEQLMKMAESRADAEYINRINEANKTEAIEEMERAGETEAAAEEEEPGETEETGQKENNGTAKDTGTEGDENEKDG